MSDREVSSDPSSSRPSLAPVSPSPLGEGRASRQVLSRAFVEGCQLLKGWRRRERFTILESGFGCGLRFLVTLAAWQSDPARSSSLHYVSMAGTPPDRPTLRSALADALAEEVALPGPGLAVAELLAQWPPALPGLHRLRFAAGAVTLTLAFGEAVSRPGRLVLHADAIYLGEQLDAGRPRVPGNAMGAELAGKGGAEERARVALLARYARPGARLAAPYDSANLRDALIGADFRILPIPAQERAPPALQAVWAPRFRRWPSPAEPEALAERSVIVVGAGLAGAAVAAGFARRGFRVDLLDSEPVPGAAGSAQALVADHPHLSPDDNPLARLSRAALLLRRGLEPGAAPDAGHFRVSGRLTLAADRAEEARQAAMLTRLGFPHDFVRQLSAEEASAIAGVHLPHGGLWLPDCEALSPATEIRGWLERAGEAVRFHASSRVHRLERGAGGRWLALAGDGRPLAAASLVVLANAGDAPRLGALAGLPLQRVRGQSTWLRDESLRPLRVVLGGDAYAVPGGDASGRLLLGASFDEGDSLLPDPADDLGNVVRLARMLGRDPEPMRRGASPAVVGLRWSLSDHLPAIGPLPDPRAVAALEPELMRNDRLPIPMAAGLYGAFAFGSRGLLWAALAAELLPALVSGEPLPVERDLLEALAPSRFLRRRLRRGA